MDVTRALAVVDGGLIFDGDGSQYAGEEPCTSCGERQQIHCPPTVFVRIRRAQRTNSAASREVAWLCPDCVARAMLQIERLGLWTN